MADDAGRPATGDMTAQEKVSRWQASDPNELDSMDPQASSLGAALHEESEDDNPEGDASSESDLGAQDDLSDLDVERISFVVNTASYSWLLAAVRSQSQLDYSQATTLQSIRSFVSARLHNYRGNRALWTQSATVKMAWDPRFFIKQQGYQDGRALLSAITITGSTAKPQLLSCQQYVRQTWPLVGESLLEALVAVAIASPGILVKSAYIPRQTRLTELMS